VTEELEEKGRSKKSKRPKVVVAPELASRFRSFWIVIAGLYLATVWLDGVGSTFPAKLTPRPWLYFSQIAALFVTAAPKVIDYRAEGWSCSERKWVEIDVRPWFHIDRDNKENRFQRALQFYRKNRTVMQALEDFVVKSNNASRNGSIGGVRFVSLRLSYPAAGERIAPYERLPLATYSGEQRHDWYWTPKPRRDERCGQHADPKDTADESDRPPSSPASKEKAKDKADDRESDP